MNKKQWNEDTEGRQTRKGTNWINNVTDLVNSSSGVALHYHLHLHFANPSVGTCDILPGYPPVLYPDTRNGYRVVQEKWKEDRGCEINVEKNGSEKMKGSIKKMEKGQRV